MTSIPLPILTQQPVGVQGVQSPSTPMGLGPSGLRKGTKDRLQTRMRAAFQLWEVSPVCSDGYSHCVPDVWLQGNIHAWEQGICAFGVSISAPASYFPLYSRSSLTVSMSSF